MYLLYILIFITAMFAYASSNIEVQDNVNNSAIEKQAVHLIMWHNAAIKRCKETTCATGIVSAKSYLSPSAKAGDAFNDTRFISYYDVSTKTLLTGVVSNFEAKTDVSDNVLFSELAYKLNGEGDSIGIYDKGTNTVVRSGRLNGQQTAVNLTVSTNFASSLPDGTPVIVAKF